MVRFASAAALLLVSACGGGGDATPAANPNSNLPADAVALEAATQSGMRSAMGRLVAYEQTLMFSLDPGSRLTPNIVFANDTSPGAAPYSVTFAGTVDSGFDEPATTSVSGKATYAEDPTMPFTSVAGHATVDVTLLGLLKVYHADVAFSVGATERTLSGSGTLQDPASGNATTMTIDAAHPLRIVPATNATANACGYVIDGDVRLAVTSAQGTYAATWHFVPAKSTVTVDAATYTSGGVVTPMPPVEADLRCNDAGATTADWNGVYSQVWGCLPFELGTGTLTLTAKDAVTVTVNDEDPPGSGNGDLYDVTVVGSSPRSLRGFFFAGPIGFRYREDFNWTLSPDKKRFFQTSRYVYQDGPNVGKGGNCFALASKQ